MKFLGSKCSILEDSLSVKLKTILKTSQSLLGFSLKP